MASTACLVPAVVLVAVALRAWLAWEGAAAVVAMEGQIRTGAAGAAGRLGAAGGLGGAAWPQGVAVAWPIRTEFKSHRGRLSWSWLVRAARRQLVFQGAVAVGVLGLFASCGAPVALFPRRWWTEATFSPWRPSFEWH